ncbi:MAG: hypothetical protein ACKOPR_04370 [Chakrabartia godavariana]
MSLVARRQRILSVRARQTRIAQIRLAEAQRRLERLEGTAGQLRRMAASLSAEDGMTDGLSLRALGEMRERLVQAAHQMETPIANAADVRDLKLADNIIARRNESTAEKMAERAAHQADHARIVRSDANRPFRPRPTRLESEN